jgi:hypothetical protein
MLGEIVFHLSLLTRFDFIPGIFSGEAGNRGSLCRCFRLLALHLVSSELVFAKTPRSGVGLERGV